MNMQARLARSAARARKALAAGIADAETPKAMKRLERRAKAARRAQVEADRQAAAWDDAGEYAF